MNCVTKYVNKHCTRKISSNNGSNENGLRNLVRSVRLVTIHSVPDPFFLGYFLAVPIVE